MSKEYDPQRWKIRWWDDEGGAGTEEGTFDTKTADAWVDHLNEQWPERTYEKYKVTGYDPKGK